MMRIVAQMSCDYCGATLTAPSETAAIGEASRTGWILDRELDHMCPDCVDRADLDQHLEHKRAIAGANLVKPSAAALAAAMVADDWDGASWPDDLTVPDQRAYLRRAHAALKLWPGRSAAAVLRDTVAAWCHADEDHQLHLQRCVPLLEEAARLNDQEAQNRRRS